MNQHANHSNSKKIFFIKYHPELKGFFGSQEAALIFQKLEYWSVKYPVGFWKFFEPCDHHPQYREGDSWSEELGFSRRVFLRAFAIIGTHYKSKSEYLKQADPFQGKMYVSYYDRKTNRTHFFRDHGYVDCFLKSFWEKAKKISKVVKEKVVKHCIKEGFNGRSRNNQDGRSFVRALDISLQRSTSSLNTNEQSHDRQSEVNPFLPPDLSSFNSQINCSNSLDDINISSKIIHSNISDLAKPQPQIHGTKLKEEKDCNLNLAQNMLNIWNDVTGNHQFLRSDLKVNLPKAFSQFFQGSLENWTDFCLIVASSKFLMGEATNTTFKAYLAWLIKPDTIAAIQDQHYSLGDREVKYYRPSLQNLEGFKRDQVQGSESWKQVCEQLCDKLGYATFKSWFKDLKLMGEETSRPVLQCPNRFMRDWITGRYHRDIETIVREILPHTTHLVLTCA